MNNNFDFKIIRKKAVSIVLGGLFFLEGMMFYNHYTYAYHVDQAKEGLSELEEILNENRLVDYSFLSASILGMLEVEDKFFSEVRLKHLTDKIVNSTERAIENADDIRKTDKLKTAIDEISELQEDQVEVIHKATRTVKDEKIIHKIHENYDKAVDLKDKVQVAKAEVQEALDAGQDTIEIDIPTSKDKHHGGENHDEEHEEEPVVKSHKATLNRIEKKKEEDARQREINRERILLIEEGKAAKRQQEEQAKIKREQALQKKQQRKQLLARND